MRCPHCKAVLKRHETLIGFDVAFFRCESCQKNFSQAGGILDDLLGAPPLVEVDDHGNRVVQKR